MMLLRVLFFDHLTIVVFEWMSGDWCTHVTERERDRETERQTERERDRERERERVCVCIIIVC